jgi:anaerobic sulfite reductase subunit C
MKWNDKAAEAVSRVPFFIRKRVKKKIEEEARLSGASEVTIGHVDACRQRFLNNMDDEVKGYQVETCFGPSGCPNRAVRDDDFARELESLAARKNLRSFLKDRVPGPLKLHHEFTISISDCPNACSRPQIADIGLIAAAMPLVEPSACTACGACKVTCCEDAVRLSENAESVEIAPDKCLACGACVKACPSNALHVGSTGYRVMLGGKLGRRPQLAKELDRIFCKREALEIVDRCLQLYMSLNKAGERFGEVLNRTNTRNPFDGVSSKLCFKKTKNI